MRRLLAVLALAVGLGILVAPAAAAPGDVNGPKCADITGGDWGYRTAANGDRIFTISVFLAAPACQFIDYTLTTDAGGPASPTGTCVFEGAAGCLQYVVNFGPSGPGVICFSVTTSVGNGHHVFDAAPDVGCLSAVLEGSGGQTGFN